MNKENIRKAACWLEHLENLQHSHKNKKYYFPLTGQGYGFCFDYKEEIRKIELEAKRKWTAFLKKEIKKYEEQLRS